MTLLKLLAYLAMGAGLLIMGLAQGFIWLRDFMGLARKPVRRSSMPLKNIALGALLFGGGLLLLIIQAR